MNAKAKAKAEVKLAVEKLHKIAAEGGSLQKKSQARYWLEIAQLNLHAITGNVNDLPASCDSGF